MPPLPRLRIAALNDLAKQLRFAPTETLRRQLERTEQLAAEIDPSRNYPEDWVAFRVTGYRPQADDPATFVGEALLGDLSALVERLSAAARVSESDLNGARYLAGAELCARWDVSSKTLERYRRKGLIARRVLARGGASRLAYALEAVERFEALQRDRLEAASRYTRIEPALRERMVRLARRYRARLGWSLNQTARRLASRFGRGHETVRQLLRNHAADAFVESGPPAARERRLIDRAHWLAIEPGRVAERLGRSKASVQRVINDARAQRLRELMAGGGPLIGADRSRRTRPPLTPATPDDQATLFGCGAPTDLLELVRQAREIPPVPVALERLHAAAYHSLMARAGAAIADLPKHGARATALDRIETDLRWAARVKAVLVRSQLPLLVRTLEAATGRPLEEVRGSLLAPLVEECIAALAAGVDAFDAGRGGRLAAPAGLALTRVATRFMREHASELGHGPGRARATMRLGDGVRIADWTLRVAPWQSRGGRWWLEPDRRVRPGMDSLDDRARTVLQRRYGWGCIPGTLSQVAAAIGTTPMATARLERRGVHEALTASGARPR